jgi:2-C-methyl-D-erythritol 4-phosphate cytidylyltransferase
MKAGAIIPAAGSGERMGGTRKAFLELSGKPLLQHCLESFFAADSIAHIAIALPADAVHDLPAWLRDDRITVVPGGAQRADSVRAGLQALPADVDVIVIHDAARPLVSAEMIERVIEAAAGGVSAAIALQVTDTLHEVDAQQQIVSTPDRARFWRAQTPQAFPRAALEAAYARTTNVSAATDEAGMVAAAGLPVRMLHGEVWNIKITTPEDVALAEATLARRHV